MLHAKLLVIDGRRALFGWANLTHRTLTANLEAGVLVEECYLAAHIRGLISAGTLVGTPQAS